MRRLCLAALAMLALPTAAVADEREADIAALSDAKLNAWPRFYRQQDWEGLSAFLASGFKAVQPDGSIETREQAIEWVRANPWAGANNNFRYQIRAIDFYSDIIANVHGTGRYDGENCTLAYQSANIFIKQEGRWKAMFSQTTAPQCESK